MPRDTEPAIKLAILFGSRASGKAGTNSDTDVALLGDHPLSLDEKALLAVRFAARLNVSEDALDLIDLWDAPLSLNTTSQKEENCLRGIRMILCGSKYLPGNAI